MDIPTSNVPIRDTPESTGTHNAGCMNTGSAGSAISSPRKKTTDCHKEGQEPDYKHQCHSFIPTLNSSIIEVPTPENQQRPVRCSDTSSSSLSTLHCSYIPVVFGELLPEDQTIIDAVVDSHNEYYYNTTTSATNQNVVHQREIEVPGISPTSEQAPVPQMISVKRESMESKQSTLSNAEKRYWIKVVVFAIIINTLIVMGGVIGGVCGISGCNFSNDHEYNAAVGGNDMYGDVNVTNTPTPAPSRRLVASDYPVIAAENATNVTKNDFDESVTYPSVTPFVTLQPTILTIAIGDTPTKSPVNKLLIILPIAIMLDALFTVAYLFYHYNRWIRRKNNTEA